MGRGGGIHRYLFEIGIFLKGSRKNNSKIHFFVLTGWGGCLFGSFSTLTLNFWEGKLSHFHQYVSNVSESHTTDN